MMAALSAAMASPNSRSYQQDSPQNQLFNMFLSQHSGMPGPIDSSSPSSTTPSLGTSVASSVYSSSANSSKLEPNSGHGSSSSSATSDQPPVKNSIKLCRRRKARTVFSDQQLSGLEKRFETQKYLSTPERVELANSLGLSETQVIIYIKKINDSLSGFLCNYILCVCMICVKSVFYYIV